MITMFHVTGAYIYVDVNGLVQGVEDVFSKIDLARAHFEKVGPFPDIANIARSVLEPTLWTSSFDKQHDRALGDATPNWREPISKRYVTVFIIRHIADYFRLDSVPIL